MEIEDQLRQVGRRHATLTRRLEPVERERDELILQGTEAGLSRRRIAELVGISFQRVDQIVRAAQRAA